GGYHVAKGQPLVLLFTQLHRDPKVWGDDAEEFRPERMLDGKFEALPPNAWKPFGNGKRACIGRGFAIQEALLALAIILSTTKPVAICTASYEGKPCDNAKDFVDAISAMDAATAPIKPKLCIAGLYNAPFEEYALADLS
ncbi:cytochrome P450, partial [Tilletiaria anomala UBC 951]